MSGKNQRKVTNFEVDDKWQPCVGGRQNKFSPVKIMADNHAS